MKTQTLRSRRTIDNSVFDNSADYTPRSIDYQPEQEEKSSSYIPGRDIAGYQNHFRTLRIKFLDSYMGIPQKGDPKRKEYIALLSN